MSYQNKQLEYNFLGEYFPDQEKFTPDADDLEGTNLNLLLDHGMFYASKSFFNYAKNRRILWGCLVARLVMVFFPKKPNVRSG